MSKSKTMSAIIGFVLSIVGAIIILVDAAMYLMAGNSRGGEFAVLVTILILLFSFRGFTTKGGAALGYGLLVVIFGVVAIISGVTALYDIIAILGGVVALVGGILIIVGRQPS